MALFDKNRKQEKTYNIFLGFDGFVDEILKLIRQKSGDIVIPFLTMKEFAEYLGEKSGKSCSVDMESIQKKIGGNMPIVANALGNLGCRAVCVGAMGYPELHPMFQNMSSNCELHSVSEPGYCSALEFGDGKLMLATNTSLDRLDYETLIAGVKEEELIRYFNKCDAAAFLNWGELIHSNHIWENLLERVLPQCSFDKRKLMLIDFSDFSKRDNKEIMTLLSLLYGYAQYFDIVVSLNENELMLFLEKLDIDKKGNSLEEKILTLSEMFAGQYFVVHLLKCSKYVEDGKVVTVEKEVIEEPKIITGGGDYFNAGLLLGLLEGMKLGDAIRLGSELSCLYVRDAEAISYERLIDYVFCE